MSGVSLPVTRPCGRALLVGNPTSRAEPVALLGSLGYECEEFDDPYTALLEICLRPLAFHAVILGLAGLYKEELQVIATIKRKLPQVDVWLAQTDGRHAAMAEAIRLGADGLLSEDGLHRIGISPVPVGAAPPNPAPIVRSHEPHVEPDSPEEAESSDGPLHSDVPPNGDVDHLDSDGAIGEPVLSADELRALLQEQPFMPPRGDEL